jgi:CRP-like cAMP-binding protein
VLKNGVPVDSLSSLLIFADCGTRLLRKLSLLGTEVHAKEHQVLAHEGEPGREFYVIAGGTAEVRIGTKHVTTLERGDFFGEMALVDGEPRSASVIALSPMTLYVFDPREFFTLLADFPPVSRQILRGLSDRLRHAHHHGDRSETSHLRVLEGGA